MTDTCHIIKVLYLFILIYMGRGEMARRKNRIKNIQLPPCNPFLHRACARAQTYTYTLTSTAFKLLLW